MIDKLIKAVLLGGLLSAAAPAVAKPAPVGEDEALRAAEARLAEAADLDTLLGLALRRSPTLSEANERVTSAYAKASVAAGLPDPQLKYELWNAPFSRPWKPEMHMIGLSQELPAPGSRRARAEAGREEARLAQHSRRASAEEIATQVRRAYYEYYRADRQHRIHLDHLALSQRIVELARSTYQTGRASQQDVLRAGVEVARIQTDLAAAEQQRRSAIAMLNALTDRPPNAPLGPPADLVASADEPALAEAAESLDARRPEIAAAGAAIDRSEALLRASEREARRPGFMVGVDYMYGPATEGAAHGGDPMGGAIAGTEAMHGFSLMFSMTLPWLNNRRDGEVREARATLAADREALRAARVAAGYQVGDAVARYQAAKRTHEVIEGELLPLARRSYEAAEAGFVSGQGDALALLDAERSWLQVRLDRERALAQLMTSLADLKRASGTATSDLSGSTEEN